MSKQYEFDFEDLDRRSVPELWSPDEIFQLRDGSEFQKFGEDGRLERKPAGIHAESLATWVSMWANTPPEGGLIAVGVEDDGVISGCKTKTDHVVEVERRIRCDLDPDAVFETRRVPAINRDGEPDYVLLYRIRYREDKVVETNKGEAYIRWSNSRHLLTAAEAHELRIERGQ